MHWIQRHWLKLVLATVGGIVVASVLLIAALPTLIGYGPVRNFLLLHLFDGKEVAVSVDTVSVGWFQPTRIENLRVVQNEEKYRVVLPRVANDVTLWQLVVRPRQLGNLTIESPTLVIQLPSAGSDLLDSGPATAPSLDDAKVQKALRHSIDVLVTDATVQVHKPGTTAPWGFTGIQLMAQLRPGASEEEGPTLLVPQATLMNRQQLTQEMCDDLLKFIAPVVTGVTKVEGEASLELRDIRVLLAHREQSIGEGTLHIHNTRLTGTPLVQSITGFLGIASSVEVVSDCRVTFRLADQRIWHEGLDFGVGDLRVQTSGYVGVDESLDLMARIPIPESADDAAAGRRPLLDALRGKTIEIPIIGTLDEPRIDTQRLSQSLLTTAEAAFQELLQGRGMGLDLQGADGEIDLSQIRGLAESLLEGVERDGRVLDRLRGRREAPVEDAPRGRLLERLLRRDADPPPSAPSEPLDL